MNRRDYWTVIIAVAVIWAGTTVAAYIALSDKL